MQDEGKTREIPENLASCGFICGACASPLLLSDLEVSSDIVACFRLGSTSSVIKCPKCSHERAYTCDDLKIFASSDASSVQKKAQAS